jgi:hypothetical protein
MADSKITALAALTAADPANDMVPIVDVSDTSMAASGTTKRISINNILACSPSATLASATITGDLTVDTSTLKVDSANNRVGIGTATPSADAHIRRLLNGSTAELLRLDNTGSGVNTAVQMTFYAAGTNYGNITGGFGGATPILEYNVGSTGYQAWQIAGSEQMRLNSTGLGVGEAASVSRLQARGSTTDSSAYILYGKASSGNVICFMRNDGRFLVGNGTTDNFIITETGNVGIGVTPSYRIHAAVASGSNQNIARFQVTGASNGLTITWNNTTSKMIVNFSNLPTSSAGLASGDLWIDTSAGNTLKVA